MIAAHIPITMSIMYVSYSEWVSKTRQIY